MAFPIKYDEKKRLEYLARCAREARDSDEKAGRQYSGSIAIGLVGSHSGLPISSPKLELEPALRDYDVAKEWVEKEKTSLQRDMDLYQRTDDLDIFFRTSIFSGYSPSRNTVVISGQALKLSLKGLFEQLGVPEDELKEIFEYGDRTELMPGCGFEKSTNPIGFTGRFTKDGKQKLAEILQKEITILDEPDSNPIGYNPQKFKPKNK